MAVSIISFPDPLAFTRGGRMRFQFQGNGRVQAAGTPARRVIKINGAIADNTPVVLQWNGKKESIVFKTNPSAANEFPAGSGSSDYVRDTLLPYFKSYFPFREDFTATASNFGAYQGIVLEAKQPGTAYNISRVATPGATASTIILEPILTGADPKIRERYSVYVELWLQKLGTPGTEERHFERIYNEFIDADETGLAEFDAGELLHGYLVADLPDFVQNAPVHCERSGRRYFIAYAESYGSPVRPGLIKTDDIRSAYLGGADFEHRAGAGFLLEPFVQAISPQEDRALRFGGEMRYILPDQPEWLTFINTRSQSPSVVLRVRLTFDDGSGINLVDLIPAFTFTSGQKWTLGVGPLQLKLHEHVPQGRGLSEYTVRLMTAGADPNGNSFLSRQYRYIIGYQYEPFVRHFAYVNSLGAYDTLTTFGKGTRELQRVSKQAERVVPAQYELSDAQFLDYNITLQQQHEVTTGFRSEFELRRWNDFYRSQLRYRVNSFGDGTVKAIQIGIISKSIQQHKDADRQFAHKFEYAELHQDEFYTPDATDADPISPLGLVTAGSPNVTYSAPTVVQAVDKTVPAAAREITTPFLQSLKQLVGEGLHSLKGYLTQSAGDAIYRPKALPIDYDTDLINTPVIPEVPVVNLQVATDNGSVTSRAIKAGGFGRPSFTSVAMPEAFATIAKNGPTDWFVEMTYPADVRNLLGVVRSILSGAKTGQQVLLRIAPDGSPEFIFADRDTLHSVLSRGNVSERPMVVGGIGRMNEPTEVGFANRFAVWTDPDQFGNTYIEKRSAAAVFNDGIGLIPSETLYNRIREKVLADIAAAGGSGGGGGTITSSIRYYLEEIRCFQEQVNGGRDSNGWPLDPAQRRDYFLKLLAEIGLEGAVPPGESTAPVVIPTVTRYSARIRQIYADESVATISEYIVFAPGETPVLGGVLNRILLPSERITGELFGSHSQNACQGTGIAPPYAPPAAAKTYQVVRLWKQRPIPTGPTTGTPDARYEAGVGVVVAVNATGGYPFVRLVPLDGQNFSGTAWFTPDLFDGTPPAASTFSRYFQNLPGGLYRADARAFGTSIDAPYKSATVRVPNGSPTNRAPIVASRYPDQVVSGSDDATLPAIAGTFSDPDGDTLTYSMAKVVNQTTTEALPAGISLDSAKARPVVARTVADTSVVLRLFATDPGGLRAQSDFLLTVKRKKIQSLVFVSVPTSVDEGTGFQWSAKATYNDGTVVDDIRSQGAWSLALAAGNFQAAVVTLEGVTLGSNGLMGVAADSITGNTRSYRIRCTYDGVSAEATVQVNDKTITTNRAPYIYFEMPDVPITTAGLKTFALPDDHIRDPDGDALTLQITQTDGSPLPVWLSYNPPTRTFTKADGFGAGSCAVAVKATDPGGLSVTDTFLVVVQAETTVVKPAIDIEVVSQGNGQLVINMYFRLPSGDWQRYIHMSGDPNEYGWIRLGPVNPNGPVGGYYKDIYGQPAIGSTLEIRLSPDGVNDIVTRSFTVTGVQARTNLYTAP